MRKALVIVGLVMLFAAGVGSGYLLATRRLQPGVSDGGRPGAAADGLYKDEEVAAMRKKLLTIPLPISSDNAFRLLDIDRKRLGESEFQGWGDGGNHVNLFTWRLSPTFGIAMYEEQGPDYVTVGWNLIDTVCAVPS